MDNVLDDPGVQQRFFNATEKFGYKQYRSERSRHKKFVYTGSLNRSKAMSRYLI